MWESLSWEVTYCGMSLPWERNANDQTGIRGKKRRNFFLNRVQKALKCR